MSLSDYLESKGATPPRRPGERPPLWDGPCSDTPLGGITYSLLSRFLCCRERFRLMVVEGLSRPQEFNHRIEYGSMWHLCEESLLASQADHRPYRMGGKNVWDAPLQRYCHSLCRKYRTQQEQVDHWYNVCRVAFPLYVHYWGTDHHRAQASPQQELTLLQECKFSVPYELPDGTERVVYLRGKWDAVALIENGPHAGLWLRETKTKGDIRENQIRRQLSFDLQTMLYLVALTESIRIDGPLTAPTDSEEAAKGHTIRGVLYNVSRRPLSGGKGTIVRHKARGHTPEESKESYYARVASYIENAPEEYFMRWRVGISLSDIDRFKRECLSPILSQLCDWWEWITVYAPRHKVPSTGTPSQTSTDGGPFSPASSLHWRHPYGVYNALDEGGVTDFDDDLATGSDVGLDRVDTLFPELER
jgi:hypothetical protein